METSLRAQSESILSSGSDYDVLADWVIRYRNESWVFRIRFTRDLVFQRTVSQRLAHVWLKLALNIAS